MSTDAAVKRGPYAGTRKRREKIARATLELVQERGHESVTIAQVAERSGSSEATVLYHFPSRDHLLVAALELDDSLVMTAHHLDEGEPVFDLDELHDTASSASRDDPMLRLLLAIKGLAISPEHPGRSYLERRTAAQIDIFTRMVANRQRDALAHPGLDARQIAIEMIAMWDGLTGLWFAGVEIDLGEMLVGTFRRLAGENVMQAQAIIRDSEFGL
ncbi:TetR/AcrR family transcriptional regulator [Naasia lichenicola]|uniref:TetR/AcrR family transcriptional regulator n=1 Tax=Naasia lichenicola TaxID=2565933 RepID=UPI00130E635A|nr:TetR/AcrR family transcriptional regulator [Naasia lichenicola]